MVRDGMVTSVLFCFLLGLTACLGLNAGETKRNAPDKVIKQGPWELQIYYRNQGTRSEGQRGVLLYQDIPVKAKEVGEEKKTDLGLMKYYGPENEQKVPWAPSGWNFADKGKMLPSWQEQKE
jgi:hypothetical protein